MREPTASLRPGLPQDRYLARGAEHVGEPEVDETAEVRWVPVGETPAMIARGDILGRLGGYVPLCVTCGSRSLRTPYRLFADCRSHRARGDRR